MTRAREAAARSDVAGTFGAGSINRLYELSITAGCGARLYCPADALLRDARWASSSTTWRPTMGFVSRIKSKTPDRAKGRAKGRTGTSGPPDLGSQPEPEIKVMLNADRKLQYAEVRTRFRLIQEVGFQGVQLKVLQRKSDAG